MEPPPARGTKVRMVGDASGDQRVGKLEEDRAGPAGQQHHLAMEPPRHAVPFDRVARPCLQRYAVRFHVMRFGSIEWRDPTSDDPSTRWAPSRQRLASAC